MMNHGAMGLTSPATGTASVAPDYDDPLDEDSGCDVPFVTTRRSLTRIALVAAETAARFAREMVDVDPMAWLLAPRRLFGGRTALDACQSRDDCLLAILLHGLSIGMDADPGDIDALVSDSAKPDADTEAAAGWFSDRGVEATFPTGFQHGDLAGAPRLWTSVLASRSNAGSVQAFDAVVARERSVAEEHFRCRHGPTFDGDAEVIDGFDPSLPLVEALLSPALVDMLRQVAADPASPLAEGLSISVRQSFAA